MALERRGAGLTPRAGSRFRRVAACLLPFANRSIGLDTVGLDWAALPSSVGAAVSPALSADGHTIYMLHSGATLRQDFIGPPTSQVLALTTSLVNVAETQGQIALAEQVQPERKKMYERIYGPAKPPATAYSERMVSGKDLEICGLSDTYEGSMLAVEKYHIQSRRHRTPAEPWDWGWRDVSFNKDTGCTTVDMLKWACESCQLRGGNGIAHAFCGRCTTGRPLIAGEDI